MKLLAVLFLLLGFAGSSALAQEDRKALREEVYARRYRALDKKDVDGLVALAAWCAEKKLKTYANLLYRKALKLDPENDAANAAFGNEKIEGKWYTPAEAEEIRAQLEAKKRAAAAAEVADAKVSRLVPPGEEASRRAVHSALVANEKKATELKKAYVEALGAVRTRYCAAVTDHAFLVAKAPPAFAEYLAQVAEYVYRRLNWIMWEKKEGNTFKQFGGQMGFWLMGDPALEITMDFLKKHYPEVARFNNLKEHIDDIRKFKLEFTSLHWPPMHIHLNTKNQSSAVANAMARSWMEHNSKPWYAEIDITRGRPKEFSMMAWMLEGLGIWASLEAIGSNRLFRIEKPRYADQKMAEKDVELNYPGIAHDLVTTGESEGRKGRSFYQLCRARMNTWHIIDLAISFALVDYLIRERLEDWRALVRELDKQKTFRGAFVTVFGNDEEKRQAAEALARTHRDGDLERAFRPAAERFEKAWKKWVAKAYEELRDDPEKYTREAPFGKEPKRKKRR